jgi:CDP-glucose 4,6-dehydratase
MKPCSPTFWRGRSVFVTGGTGLVGGWLVKDLVARGSNVVILLRDGSVRGLLAHEGLLGKFAAVRGSLGDFDIVRQAFHDHRIQTVFHLGAQTQVGTAKQDPLGTLEVNVQGTWQVLEAARQAGVQQVIVASSGRAYGRRQLPVTESTALSGSYPYDVSKSCADLIARMYALSFELPVVIGRWPNIFGGGDFNTSRLIPDLIRRTWLGERFTLRSNGKCVRDYLHIHDAVRAYLLLAEQLAVRPELSGEAFNFSLGVRATVLDIVEIVLQIMGRTDLTPLILNQTNEEVLEQTLDSEKARTILGWVPEYSLEAGLEETVAWYCGYFAQRNEAAFGSGAIPAVASSGGA